MKIVLLFSIFWINYCFCNSNNISDDIIYPRFLNDLDSPISILNSRNPCRRKCVKNAAPLTCRYEFSIEWYHILSKACYNCPLVLSDCDRKDCIVGNGYKRPVTVVNRRLPGPLIEVCQNDEVIVNIRNHLGTETTTIHWHGQLQKGTPYMDGVPFVTQCPIGPGDEFQYHFRAMEVGTHFWHSHSGLQRTDGALGGFIVRAPNELNPQRHLYDYDLSEHVIIVQDWTEKIGIAKFAGRHHSDDDNKPDAILINGRGRRQYVPTTIYTPSAHFYVSKGYRYRFRLIHSGYLNCPIEVSIINHTMQMISGDGYDFVPFEVDSFVVTSGERYDFVLNANNTIDTYWIHFRGMIDCDERFNSVHQVAVLQYNNNTDNAQYPIGLEPNYNDGRRGGRQLNPLNLGVENRTQNNHSYPLPLLEHKGNSSVDELVPIPDFQYYLVYDMYPIDNTHFYKPPYYSYSNVTDPHMKVMTPQLNYITMKLLPFPLLSQREQITDSMICNETYNLPENCDSTFCECTHIVNMPLNAIVELVLIDKGVPYDVSHPFHMHGHSFRVVAMERLGTTVVPEDVVQRDKAHLIWRNLENPPVKDTVSVPDGGYTIIRFKTINPGYWLFHCHLENHMAMGMSVVLKIGSDTDQVPVPKDFPKCGTTTAQNSATKSVFLSFSQHHSVCIKITIMILFQLWYNSLHTYR